MKKTAIVYENDEILILHKAAGVAVQGGEGVAHPLDQALSEELGYKVHLVHRLDKDTSGLLVVAKNAAAAAKWISLIQSKQVKKEYTALCFGTPVINGKEMERGTISDAVTKGSRTLNAVTHFSVTRTIHLTAPHAAASAEQAADNTGAGSADTGSTRAGNTGAEPLVLTELHLVLGTGRMHQIRIHLAKAHCPIAGDDKHGDFKKNKLAKKYGVKGLHLCASALTLPLESGMRTFTVPPHWEVP